MDCGAAGQPVCSGNGPECDEGSYPSDGICGKFSSLFPAVATFQGASAHGAVLLFLFNIAQKSVEDLGSLVATIKIMFLTIARDPTWLVKMTTRKSVSSAQTLAKTVTIVPRAAVKTRPAIARASALLAVGKTNRAVIGGNPATVD